MSSENGWRGGEQQLAYLLGDLMALGVTNVLAVKSGSRLERFSHEKGISCYSLRFSNSFDFLSAREINRICRNEKIDLIHLHTSKAHGVAVLSALLGNRVPMVLSRRVAFFPGTNFLSKWKYNHPQIRKIICVSEKVREIMEQFVGERSKCVTIYSGIDLKRFAGMKRDRQFLLKEFDIKPETTIVLSIGAIDASKDHFTFVDTIAKLCPAHKVVHGLIVGDGPLATRLKDYVREKGVEDHVTFAGYRNDVGSILVSTDVFLMTSREEGLGTSILDAFLARIPVVATAAGGIPEMVIDGQTGLLAPVMDSQKLSERILRLLSDDAFRGRVVNQAYASLQKFSKEETSSKTHKVYQEVLNR